MASAGKGLFPLRWQLATRLWAADIAAEFGLTKADPSPVEQYGYANSNGIPFVVIFGEDERQRVSKACQPSLHIKQGGVCFPRTLFFLAQGGSDIEISPR